MTIDVTNASQSVGIGLGGWAAAEIFDMPFSADISLRAIVCKLSNGGWQWTVNALDGVRGELISTGVEKSAAAARLMAASEVAKCLEGPLD